MIVILMATYNGSQFIRLQLDSILNQTYEDWNLLIRDDNSDDDTLKIIKEYCEMDSRISLLSNQGNQGSAVANFSALFDYAKTLSWDYMMFADQDDIWLPHKIQASLAFIKDKEAILNPSTPVLIFTDFQYMDVDGKHINQILKMPDMLTPAILVNENHAYGCTMIFNTFLADRIVNIPLIVENHDYWIALVACFFGKTYLNKEKLLKYRQHSNNVSGGVKNRTFISRLNRYILNVDYLLPLFITKINMLQLFHDRYKLVLNKSDEVFLKTYLCLIRKNNFVFLSWMIKNKVKKIGFMPTLAYYYIILMLRKKIAQHV